jgi:hypothetical protein
MLNQSRPCEFLRGALVLAACELTRGVAHGSRRRAGEVKQLERVYVLRVHRQFHRGLVQRVELAAQVHVRVPPDSHNTSFINPSNYVRVTPIVHNKSISQSFHVRIPPASHKVSIINQSFHVPPAVHKKSIQSCGLVTKGLLHVFKITCILQVQNFNKLLFSYH